MREKSKCGGSCDRDGFTLQNIAVRQDTQTHRKFTLQGGVRVQNGQQRTVGWNGMYNHVAMKHANQTQHGADTYTRGKKLGASKLDTIILEHLKVYIQFYTANDVCIIFTILYTAYTCVCNLHNIVYSSNVCEIYRTMSIFNLRIGTTTVWFIVE